MIKALLAPKSFGVVFWTRKKEHWEKRDSTDCGRKSGGNS